MCRLISDRLNPHVIYSEEAVEYDELDVFFRLKEDYDPHVEEDRPLLPAQTIGVPGAASPAQMTPEHHKPAIFPSASPLKGKGVPVNKRDDEFDVGTELSGFGLQGVHVTHDDLAALVAELGLGGDEADDLVKGLSSNVTESTGNEVADEDKVTDSGTKAGGKDSNENESPSALKPVPGTAKESEVHKDANEDKV